MTNNDKLTLPKRFTRDSAQREEQGSRISQYTFAACVLCRMDDVDDRPEFTQFWLLHSSFILRVTMRSFLALLLLFLTTSSAFVPQRPAFKTTTSLDAAPTMVVY